MKGKGLLLAVEVAVNYVGIFNLIPFLPFYSSFFFFVLFYRAFYLPLSSTEVSVYTYSGRNQISSTYEKTIKKHNRVGELTLCDVLC